MLRKSNKLCNRRKKIYLQLLEQIYIFLQQKLKTIQQLIISYNLERNNRNLDYQLALKSKFLRSVKEIIEQQFDCKKVTLMQESSDGSQEF
jgi:hypothetical protein